MIQQNKGKISIRHGKKNGEQLVWSDIIGEKEYLYPGEAREALEEVTWDTAEHICNQKLNDSYALLFELSAKKDVDWEKLDERLLLYFIEEERESINQAKARIERPS